MVQIWYKNKSKIRIIQVLSEKYWYKNMVQLVELHHILLLIIMCFISLPRSRHRLRHRRFRAWAGCLLRGWRRLELAVAAVPER